MKYPKLLLLLTVLVACKKNSIETPLLASVNVVHAVVNVPAIKVNTTGDDIVYATFTDSIKYGAGKLYSINAIQLAPLSIVNTADVAKPLLHTSLPEEPGAAWSLFLSGQSPVPDTLWVQEMMSNYTDSLVGVRFINLSPNLGKLSINIKGTTQPEVTGLAYKQITAIKPYAARSTNTSYIFEVKDEAGGLVTSFTLSVYRFHNHTVVIRGLKGVTGTYAPGAFQVNYY